MERKLTEKRLVDYVAFISPDKSLTNFKFTQEYGTDGCLLQQEHKRLILDIVIDDSTGGDRKIRESRPEELTGSIDFLKHVEKQDGKEYKFVHFTITNEEGHNKYITLIMFHIDDYTNKNYLCTDYDSGSKNPFGTKMRTFFKTKRE